MTGAGALPPSDRLRNARMNDVGREFDREHQYQMRLEQVLRVAAGSFNQKGFAGTSLKAVAAQLNVTDAALYYYVKNKEELIFRCYDRAIKLCEVALRQADREGDDGLAKVERYIDLQLTALCGPEGPVAIVSEIPSLNATHREQLLRRARAVSRELAGFISEGISDGSVRECNAELACAAIMGALNWVPKWFQPGGNRGSLDQIRQTYVELLGAGLRRDRR